MMALETDVQMSHPLLIDKWTQISHFAVKIIVNEIRSISPNSICECEAVLQNHPRSIILCRVVVDGGGGGVSKKRKLFNCNMVE